MHLIATNSPMLLASITWWLTPANWPVIIAGAVGLGLIVFVHELGHFLVAKACGVKCEKFYLGFDIYGLKLCKFQWGETEYGIGILPLGGYVKMLGQDDNPARIAEENQRAQLVSSGAQHAPAMTHGDLPPEPVADPHSQYDPRSYMAQSVPKRMAIISAGVIMNVIFAFIMAAVAYAIGVKETPCIVRAVVPGGAAWKADLQPGDMITQIGDVANPRFRDLQAGVTLGNVEHGIGFVIQRPGQTELIKVTLHPDNSLGLPLIGIVGPMQPILNKKQPTIKYSPAGRAEPKFEPGDIVLKVGDENITLETQIDHQLALHPDDQLRFSVDTSSYTPVENILEHREHRPATIAVDPTAMRDFGVVMAAEPIIAVQDGSPAAKEGIKPGDRLTAIDGQPVGDPILLPDKMRQAALANQKVVVEVARKSGEGDQTENLKFDMVPRIPQFNLEMHMPGPMAVQALGIAFKVSTKVTAVLPDSPAAKAGIESGDELLAVEILAAENSTDDSPEAQSTGKTAFDKEISWPLLMYEILPMLNPQRTVRFWVQHGQKERTVELHTVEFHDAAGKTVYTADRGFLFEPLTYLRRAADFSEVVRLGLRETGESLSMVYRLLERMTQGQISPKLMSGFVGIGEQAGAAFEQGWSQFLLFLTLISANLAVLNFLPIPVLDGGHMVFLIYEGIRGKPADERVVIAFTYIGLILVLSLVLFTVSLDLHWISRW